MRGRIPDLDGTRKAPQEYAEAAVDRIRDYSVFEGEQRIGRIRFAGERQPGVRLWNVVVHLTGGLPMGSSQNLEQAKAEFRTAWETLKARTTPEQLAAAYREIRRTRAGHDVTEQWPMLKQMMAEIIFRNPGDMNPALSQKA